MKSTLQRLMKEEKGAALVLTLVLLLVGGLIMAPLLGYMGTGHIAAGVHEKRMGELYAADAGIEDAVWRIQNPVAGGLPAIDDCNDQWAEEFGPYEIDVNGTTVIVSIDYLGDDQYRVVSTTTGGDSTTAVESYVFYGSHWHDILNFGVIALNGNIGIDAAELNSYPNLDQARIYANGDIVMTGKSKVSGDAYATGDIVKGGQAEITGEEKWVEDPIEFRFPDLTGYWNEANSGELIDRDLKVTADRTLGPARITGNLDIESQAELTLAGSVWVDGDIYTAGGTRIIGKGPLVASGRILMVGGGAQFPDQLPVIISTADYYEGDDYAIWFAGKVDSYMVLYARWGRITITGSADVNGAAVGRTITISSAKCNAIYDMEVVDRVRAPYIVVLTWEVELQ